MSISQDPNKRVEKLFSDIKNLADQSLDDSAKASYLHVSPLQVQMDVQEDQRKIEELKARVCELEASLAEVEKQRVEETSRMAESGFGLKKDAAPSAPLLYEKEQVGFAFVGDEVVPVRGDQKPVPDNADVIKSPLVSSGRRIGEVKVTKPAERELTTDDIKLANAVAQQASVQIESLRLLAEAERARTEAEEATHQFTHRNWANFLDAIHNAERIGYSYDQSAVEPFTDPAPAQYDHEEIMETLNEQIGRLFVKGNGAFTEDDKKFMNTIGKQVGQQVENIRLLADASRARAEAEEATRSLTRQNWETYTEREEGTLGFVYDSLKVSPLNSGEAISGVVLAQPLYVRGQEIGQLSVKGLANVSQEARDMAAAIAAQTSIHLEALRLTEELQKRAQELKELDRLKSAFLANMSHELRTPLNSILGFADVMLEGLDGPLTENMDNDLGLIQKNGQHLLHLINDVLDMAKIDSGKMNLHVEKFNVNDLFMDVISITSSLAKEKSLKLVIESDSDAEVEVNADKIRLRQVMINLVNNAMKFTEKGQVTIHVQREDNDVRIRVKDTGIGIPADHLESVFQEFTQVDTTTTRKVGGTGLGLPISRRLISMHSGRLWAESSGINGEGSTFYVHLPIEANINENVTLAAN